LDSHQWRVVAASACGTSHERTGHPCQDAYHWQILPKGILVAAVADGAGSASLGALGADIAARVAVEVIAKQQPALYEEDNVWQSLLKEALMTARAVLYAEAEACEVSERELATTLILVAATSELVAAVQVGDGASVMSDTKGSITGITAPQTGEYINQTMFLTSPTALNIAQPIVWRGTISHVALFSDGLQMLALKMPEGVPHTPFFAPLFRFVAEAEKETEATLDLETFLKSPRVRNLTDDDLTLLLGVLTMR